MKRYAVFTMDVEAFSDAECLKNKTYKCNDEMFDGLDNYLALLDKYAIKSNLFVVANNINLIEDKLKAAIKNGHKIGIHGLTHTPSVLLTNKDFKYEISESKRILEERLNTTVDGYRAPCFSINDDKIDILNECGITFDSSFLNNSYTYYHGKLKLEEFEHINNHIYRKNGLYEFSMPVSKKFPIGGGGYVRLFPWMFVKSYLKKYLLDDNNELYVFYLHPFEVSNKKIPYVKHMRLYDVFYLHHNRYKFYLKRIEKIINLLMKNNFEFTTFNDLKDIYK